MRRMDQNHKKVEAVLFAVGKEITTERVASLCGLSVEESETIICSLQQEYELLDRSLKLVKRELSWKLTVRDEYVPLVSSIVTSLELERPLMETLAIIAWKYPIVQSDVIKLRSPAAYDHMRELELKGLIAKEKFGRTFRVKLTPKFFEYFDLPTDLAKQAFLNEVPAEVLSEAAEVEKETDEVERLIELEGKESETRSEIEKAMSEMKKEE